MYEEPRSATHCMGVFMHPINNGVSLENLPKSARVQLRLFVFVDKRDVPLNSFNAEPLNSFAQKKNDISSRQE